MCHVHELQLKYVTLKNYEKYRIDEKDQLWGLTPPKRREGRIYATLLQRTLIKCRDQITEAGNLAYSVHMHPPAVVVVADHDPAPVVAVGADYHQGLDLGAAAAAAAAGHGEDHPAACHLAACHPVSCHRDAGHQGADHRGAYRLGAGHRGACRRGVGRRDACRLDVGHRDAYRQGDAMGDRRPDGYDHHPSEGRTCLDRPAAVGAEEDYHP